MGAAFFFLFLFCVLWFLADVRLNFLCMSDRRVRSVVRVRACHFRKVRQSLAIVRPKLITYTRLPNILIVCSARELRLAPGRVRERAGDSRDLEGEKVDDGCDRTHVAVLGDLRKLT